MFHMLKRYGWIGAIVIVGLVGGAAANEWYKSTQRAAAESLGDQIFTALEAEDVSGRSAALAAIPTTADNAAVLDMLIAAGDTTDGNLQGAVDRLDAIAANQEIPEVYRDLAILKRSIVGADLLPAEDRLAALSGISAPGAPFRLLAEEQIALIEVNAGETEAAIARLIAISSDTEVTSGLRRRAQALIVALGGTPEAA
nr:hypothetical protein [Cochlodiniinecator piscidefendens]